MPNECPNPLVTADVDLRAFPYTPIFRARLFGSEFHADANDAEWRAGVTLWLKSWDQVPAGTLPTADVALCRLAELGRDMRSWQKVKAVALHGWFECIDGRLHHRVVSEGVNEAWRMKVAQQRRTAAAREERLRQRQLQTEPASVTDPVTQSVEPLSHHPTEGKGIEGNGNKKESPPKPPRGGGRVVSLTDAESAEFEEWWKAWPIHEGKAAAKGAFRLARTKVSLDELVRGACQYASRLLLPDAPRPKWPQGWLNEERWCDEFPAMRPNGANSNGSTNGRIAAEDRHHRARQLLYDLATEDRDSDATKPH